MTRKPPLAVLAFLVVLATPLAAEEPPPFLFDRGSGVTTSLFGTYIQKGEFLVYPFYEYTTDDTAEYKPSELGFELDEDFFGKKIEHEYLLFVAYGITDDLAIELEGALYTKASLDKSPDDPSLQPQHIEESGVGDVETNLRWRWSRETARRPELFSFFKVVFPLQEDKLIIGTQEWEYEAGFGAIKGLSWGTITGRVSIAWDDEEGKAVPGEYAVEYLRRVSRSWRLVACIEGEDDEVQLVGEAQWHISDHAFLKLNTGFGITKKAPDFAPEIGIMISF